MSQFPLFRLGTFRPVTALSTSVSGAVITFSGGRQLGGRVSLNIMVSWNCNVISTSLYFTWCEDIRPKRSVQYGIGWPPQSYENTIEVLVVVDGSMTKYHGAGVKKYVLDLMNIVNITFDKN